MQRWKFAEAETHNHGVTSEVADIHILQRTARAPTPLRISEPCVADGTNGGARIRTCNPIDRYRKLMNALSRDCGQCSEYVSPSDAAASAKCYAIARLQWLRTRCAGWSWSIRLHQMEETSAPFAGRRTKVLSDKPIKFQNEVDLLAILASHCLFGSIAIVGRDAK